MQRRRVPHAIWAAGAAAILGAIVLAVLRLPPPRVEPPPEERAHPPRPLPSSTSPAGRVPCGFCDGDGRLDARDLARPAPRLDLKEGPCAACEGRGGR